MGEDRQAQLTHVSSYPCYRGGAQSMFLAPLLATASSFRLYQASHFILPYFQPSIFCEDSLIDGF